MRSKKSVNDMGRSRFTREAPYEDTLTREEYLRWRESTTPDAPPE